MFNLYKPVVFLSLIVSNCLPSYGQDAKVAFTIYNIVNAPVPEATININQKKYKVDSSGNAAVTISRGPCTIHISSINHYPYSLKFFVSADTSINVVMRLRESLLGNVTVTTSRNVTRNQMSTQSITGTQLRKLPVILGEVDPLKTITLLPGIKSGGEASAGIYVRGGGPDQNLVLLDGIPVYNPNHLLGFFSIFNGEAVKNMEVIKGGIPPEYGGRLSSVIAIDTREGNKNSISGSGGIGLISSRISLEGPIIKGKSSFIISARRTYIDQVGRLVAKSRIRGNGYFFYDINAKADYTINNTNQLLFTFYSGRDRFSFEDPDEGRDGSDRIFNVWWGNTLAGLAWKQQL